MLQMQLPDLAYSIAGTAYVSLRCDDGVPRGLRIPSEALSMVEVIEPAPTGVGSRSVLVAADERTGLAY